MAASIKEKARTWALDVEVVDLSRTLRITQTAAGYYSDELYRAYDRPEPGSVSIKVYHESFNMIIGERPTCTLIASSAETSRNPFFHMGCAYLQDRDELYLTSDLLEAASSSRLPTVLISKLTLTRHHNDQPAGGENYVDWVEWMKLRPPPEIPMPSGAIPYERGVLYCAQGTLVQRGGLFYMPLGKPPVPLVTSYFGTPFNSIQNVAADSDGNLWFTDSTEGAQRGIRPEPKLPNHVYCFHPKTNELRVVADGFMKPTGIATNGKVFYVSDTGTSRGGSFTGPTSAATIYAFDIEKRFQEPPFLTHKRVFAFALSGKPAALTLDGAGNVYAACGDGVEVWNSKGVLLGLLQVEGGCSGLAFGKNGDFFVCAGQRLLRF